MNNVIEIDSLSKMYGKARGVKQLSLSVKGGEIFGFIGPNGAGKSTTIRTILGFLKPTSGSARIFGFDTVTQSPEIHRKVGYLPADVNFYDSMTAQELLDFSARLHRVEAAERIKQLSARLDLDLSKKFRSLSTGNKKKVGIIQAMLHDPELLILDEPTSGLDPLAQRTFFHLLTEERDRGCTVFFSSHVLSEVQLLCNRVAIIRDGELVTVEDLKEPSVAQYRLVHVRFARPTVLPEIPGVKSVEGDGTEYRFMIQGDVNRLLRMLADNTVDDVRIEEPPLEEVFMNYYTGGTTATKEC
ncbi:hypothetical protein HMPREF1531_01812 [Propionibacterium sp. oral taxon 192 str. F0372]|uniref:ABC transporter ATP-binding protein n=1 Tax=Propionibacterium sp. oral taxon 192 TaxID=671222 RepID=UPI000353453B|nr:hypothetical protein HMPREF1531_01812 [Propionibacterium sp. oral taxon 192 str. F0372]